MLQHSLAVLLMFAAAAGIAGPLDERLRLDQRLAGFDTAGLIQDQAPSWAGLTEPIQHWAAYHEISPLGLLALLEAGRRQGLWHHGAISTAKIRALAGRLRAVAGDWQAVEQWSPGALGSIATQPIDDTSARAWRDGFARLLTDYSAALPAARAVVVSDQPPLYLPIEYDRDWWFNGVHTWTGDDDGAPMSSIDLLRDRNHHWGDDTSQIWVAAAHDGIVSRFSECFIRITHSSAWFTDYYHLENPQVDSGEEVRAGDAIANYANDLPTAICQGGHSSLPHVHFALGHNGFRVSLARQRVGEYRINPGRFSYDSSPSYMWLEQGLERLYAWVDPVQHSALTDPIDYHFNGMWYDPSLAGHGLNLIAMPNTDQTAISVFVVLFTYDDSGLANFYSGNVEVPEWRTGEPLEITLFQSANGGFSLMAPIDFDHPDDFAEAGSIRLTLTDCASGSASFTLIERSNGGSVKQDWALQKLIGVPVADCQNSE